jgi:Glycosyl transferase family 2
MDNEMPRGVSPEISIVLIASDRYGSLKMTMARLRDQTIHDAIEVVIVALSPEHIEVDPADRAVFHSLRVVPHRGAKLLADSATTGVRNATAPFVALIEDHCYPAPEWAEALLMRHRTGYAVVGAEIGNANPHSAISWCSFLLTLGAWAPPAEAREVTSVAAHNSSYTRETLLRLGEDLDILMVSETLLHWRLRELGHRVFLEPKAKAAHVNPSRLPTFLYVRFFGARAFAAIWSRDWPWLRRMHFAAIAPLAEFKRIVRVIHEVKVRKTPVRMTRLVPLLLMAWLLASAGYILGYLFGAGSSLSFASRLYFNRTRTLSASDTRRGLLSP